MKHLNLRVAVFFWMVFGAVSPATEASWVTYHYVGNDFTTVDTSKYSSPLQDVSLLSRITVSFTIDSNLIPKNGQFVLNGVDPSQTALPFTNFFMSDGDWTLNGQAYYGNAPVTKSVTAIFSTDSHGNISGSWDFKILQFDDGGKSTGLQDGYTIKQIMETSYDASSSANFDQSIFDANYFHENTQSPYDGYTANTQNSQGAWTVTTIVPLSNGLLFFAMGFVVILITGTDYRPFTSHHEKWGSRTVPMMT